MHNLDLFIYHCSINSSFYIHFTQGIKIPTLVVARGYSGNRLRVQTNDLCRDFENWTIRIAYEALFDRASYSTLQFDSKSIFDLRCHHIIPSFRAIWHFLLLQILHYGFEPANVSRSFPRSRILLPACNPKRTMLIPYLLQHQSGDYSRHDASV